MPSAMPIADPVSTPINGQTAGPSGQQPAGLNQEVPSAIESLWDTPESLEKALRRNPIRSPANLCLQLPWQYPFLPISPWSPPLLLSRSPPTQRPR